MIDKLEVFIALARTEHFGRAAEELGITQPTLSAAIKQLEDQLGVLLVKRSSRFQGLTPEGEQVLAWARRIVGDAHTMKEEMRAARHGLSGRLRIAAIPTALAMIVDLTTPFREKHPGVSFSVLSRNSVEVQTLLADRGHHRGPSIPDLIIAATAEFTGLTILHVDKDFDTISALTGQPTIRLDYTG